MEKDCGMWINILSHMLKKRMNANTQSLGITGVQSHVMHYILVKCADGPVFQRDVERAFSLSRSTATGILQLMEKNDLIRRESVASDARLKSLIPTKKAADLDAPSSDSRTGFPTSSWRNLFRPLNTCTPTWTDKRLATRFYHLIRARHLRWPRQSLEEECHT